VNEELSNYVKRAQKGASDFAVTPYSTPFWMALLKWWLKSGDYAMPRGQPRASICQSILCIL